MEQQTAKSVKPDFEMFYGIPYKAHCGNSDCGKLIWTGGKYFTIEDGKKNHKVCPHCGTPIDWED
jgi:hypothetical protein